MPERRGEFARKCAEKFGLNVVPAETRASSGGRRGYRGHCHQFERARARKRAGFRQALTSTPWAPTGSTKRELPPDLVLEKADIVAVDSVEDAHLESGDLVIPGAAGSGARNVTWCGNKSGRTSPNQITVFKSNGLAAQDVAAAGYVYEQLYS